MSCKYNTFNTESVSKRSIFFFLKCTVYIYPAKLHANTKLLDLAFYFISIA